MKTTAATRPARGRAIGKLFLPFVFILALLMAGCSTVRGPSSPTRAGDPYPTSTSAPSGTPEVAASPTPAVVDTPTVVAATSTPAAPSPPVPTKAAANAEQSIKAVIQQANEAQAKAFDNHDPSAMKDTATDSYYAHLVQTNDDMANNGVSAIKLIKIEWGPISLKGPTSAEATTFETWETTFSEGGTEQDRDRNVYELVNQSGAWKIVSDDHPDQQGGSGAGGPAMPTPGAPTPAAPPPNVPAGPGKSRNWSGYAATKGTFTEVTGTWTVPQPTSNGVTASAATWVGIGGVDRDDLIQAGTEEIVVGSGSVRYSAWIELLPDVSNTVPLAVRPGDSVTVTIARQQGTQWLVTILDNTAGSSYKKTLTYQSSLSSAEWVEEAPSAARGRRVVPLEEFGTVRVTDGSAVENGKTVTIAQSGAKPISMIDQRGTLIAEPSTLGSNGETFSVTRVGPPPTAAPTGRGRFSG